MSRNQFLALVAMALMALIGWSVRVGSLAMACEEKGGVLVRGAWGYECVEGKK